jgi:DNA-binding IclR family transcriptional regulator
MLRESLRRRIVREFEEMHGTVLTVAQATRLLHLPPVTCTRILAELVGEGRLRVRDGRYRLRGDVA